MLRAAGYDTALAGKMHFVGPDQLHGFEERLTTDVYPSGFDWTPDWRLSPAERLEWYHNMTSLLLVARRRGGDADRLRRRGLLPRRCRRSATSRCAGDTAPFFLTVSFTNPHDPWEMRQRYWDLYDEREIGRPPSPAAARRATRTACGCAT